MEFENTTIQHLNMQNDEVINKQYTNCIFKSCMYIDTKVKHCKFVDCKFDHCTIIHPIVDDCIVMNCNFVHSRLMSINWSDVESDLMPSINSIKNCQLSDQTFANLNLKEIDFSNNLIKHTLYSNCYLKESDFSNCDLEQTSFEQCDLRKAIFEDAYSYYINTKTCKLKDAVFSFPEVVNLLKDLEIKVK